ncbi:MAG: valine--tRNA ligase [Rhodospirillaceae bacterium]|nr:valine--tRNA ligase [Rhodospirillaceae bacterium]
MLDKTFQPAEVEDRQYRNWIAADAFRANPDSAKPPYTITMPPPNVTGSLHIGHALTFTLQDMLIRYHRMLGRDALWQPGTDHAGIATQMVVERQLAERGVVLRRAGVAGDNKTTIGRDDFIAKVWEWKAESGGMILNQLRKLGASADWSRELFTMDEGPSHAVRKVFVDLYRKGLIYRDKRLVNWDPKLHTAISDLEVEQREVKGTIWHIRYPIEGEEGRFIIVATTRPETMLGDSGVAVHPDDERYRDLVGKHAILPLVGRRIPIVADEYADPETGSGAVKITPAHDFNDFEVGRRHNLERINIFDADARIKRSPFDDFSWGHRASENPNLVMADEELVGLSAVDRIPESYHGLDRFVARERIIADLEAGGYLVKAEDHAMTLPYGDRSGVVIEPWLTDQWFADAPTLAKEAIAAVEDGRTRFVPEQWTKVYFEWMRNIQPWCVSRQLWWGHQIPAWYGPEGAAGPIFVAMSAEEAVTQARAHFGRDVPLTQDLDVLDTWFSSGLWPFSTLGWPEQTPELKRYYPTDVLVTGFDIIFFWVARMMMFGLEFMGDVPFRTVYIHALVRDERGQKMSKSKGNIIDPLELIGRFGADALRFTLAAMAAPGRDVKLSEARVEGYRNFSTKLWNAARFLEMNQCVLDPAFDPLRSKLPVDQWILGRLSRTKAEIETAIAAYRFNDAAHSIYHFAWHEYCDWYLELIKPVLTGSDAKAATAVRANAAWVLGEILHLLHPVMPFISEELWQAIGGKGLLIVAPWPDYDGGFAFAESEAEIDWVIRLVTAIRTMRSEMNVPPAAKLDARLRGAAAVTRERLTTHRDIILRLARLGSIEADDTAGSKGAVQIVLDEATIVLPMAGIVDLAQERARLTREIERIDAEIGKIEKKLGNPAFVDKAPAAVVDEQRERLAEAQAVRSRLGVALERLATL